MKSGEKTGMENNNENAKLTRGMGLFDLVLFNVVAIVGLRWASVAAGIGPSSLVLWLGAMLLFFIPSALTVTELSARCPREGGIYVWTREAFGEYHGFICGFFYWVNNLVYYPNLLIYLGSTFLFTFGVRFLHLEENTTYTAIFSLTVLWFAIIINTIGVKRGKWLQNLGAFGTWIPALALLVAGIISWIRFGPANVFQGNLMPEFSNIHTLSIFASLCFGFAGMELQSCMGEEIRDPVRNIPRAVLISGVMIAGVYVISTGALLVTLPSDRINIVSGVVQVIYEVSHRINAPWLGMALALLITLGGLGGIGAWMSGTARIPFVVGIDKYLPPWLARIHPRWGTPANAIITMGIISTLFVLMGTAGATVKEAYQLLVVGTLILYFIPYVYLFAAFIRWKKLNMGERTAMNYPWWLGIVGIITTIMAMGLSIIPPQDVKSPAVYLYKVIGGVVFFWIIGWVMFRQASIKKESEGEDSPGNSPEDS